MTATRRRIRPGLVVLLLGAVLLAGHATWDHLERRWLVAEIDAIKVRGEPVGRPVGAQSPAATTLAAAAVLATGLPPHPWDDAAGRGTPGAAVLEAGRTALALADQAVTQPFSSMDGAPDFTYRAAGMASLLHLVTLRTHALARAGAGDEAARSAVTGLLLRRAIGVDGLVLPEAGPDVGMVLSTTRVTDAALRAWQEAFRAAAAPDALAEAIEVARARQMDTWWRFAFGPSPTAPQHQTLPRRGVLPWLWRPWFARQMRADLQAWADALALARTPPNVRGPRLLDLDSEARAAGPQMGFVRGRWFMGMPASMARSTLLMAWHRDSLALDRVAVAALAIERYRRAEDERLPEALDALVPRFLETLPVDPYSGAPPIYRTTERGYIVYSVGPDLRDDRGNLAAGPQQRDAANRLYRAPAPDVGLSVSF